MALVVVIIVMRQQNADQAVCVALLRDMSGGVFSSAECAKFVPLDHFARQLASKRFEAKDDYF